MRVSSAARSTCRAIEHGDSEKADAWGGTGTAPHLTKVRNRSQRSTHQVSTATPRERESSRLGLHRGIHEPHRGASAALHHAAPHYTVVHTSIRAGVARVERARRRQDRHSQRQHTCCLAPHRSARQHQSRRRPRVKRARRRQDCHHQRQHSCVCIACDGLSRWPTAHRRSRAIRPVVAPYDHGAFERDRRCHAVEYNTMSPSVFVQRNLAFALLRCS